jgi:hypothetical protein
MKEPYREGLANHPDPESCVPSREGSPSERIDGQAEGFSRGCEALTGAALGQVLSREITTSGSRRRPASAEGNTEGRVYRECPSVPARSETLSTKRNSAAENREIPRLPTERWAAKERPKATNRR